MGSHLYQEWDGIRFFSVGVVGSRNENPLPCHPLVYTLVRYMGYFKSCSYFCLLTETVVSMGMVQQLVAILRTPHSPFHEHVLGALCW